MSKKVLSTRYLCLTMAWLVSATVIDLALLPTGPRIVFTFLRECELVEATKRGEHQIVI